MAKEINDYTTYCGKPLVKNGNIICYGNPARKAILILTVLTTKDFHGVEIPDMIFVQVQDAEGNWTIDTSIVEVFEENDEEVVKSINNAIFGIAA